MKKLAKIVSITLLIAMLFSVPAYAYDTNTVTYTKPSKDSCWAYYALVDDFGDLTGAYDILLLPDNYPEGTFSNANNTDTPIWVGCNKNEALLVFYFYIDNKLSSQISNTSSKNDVTFTVSIKDDDDKVHSYFGFMPHNSSLLFVVEDESQYMQLGNVDDIKYEDIDEIIDLFSSNDTLKFTIRSKTNDKFKFTMDMKGFEASYKMAEKLSK